MIKHTNFHPEVNRLLDLFTELQASAQLRANTIIKNGIEIDEITKARAQAAADAYGFMKLMLYEADI